MGLKKPRTTRTRPGAGTGKPTGITLGFEGNVFFAKLVKFEKMRYPSVASIVERAFKRAFGDNYNHKRGAPEWSKTGADPDQADEVAKFLGHYTESLSVTYDKPEVVDVPTPKTKNVVRNKNKAAIDVLRRAVFGDGTLSVGIDGEIADGEKRINNLAEELRRAQNALEGLKVKRSNLLESIRGLGGSTL